MGLDEEFFPLVYLARESHKELYSIRAVVDYYEYYIRELYIMSAFVLYLWTCYTIITVIAAESR